MGADGWRRTTTELTTSFATAIANLLGLGSGEKVVEAVIRGVSSLRLWLLLRGGTSGELVLQPTGVTFVFRTWADSTRCFLH
jgi:hypothetical protein